MKKNLKKAILLLCATLIFSLPLLACGKNATQGASLIDLFASAKGSVAVVETYYSQGTGFTVKKTSDSLYVVTNKHLFFGSSNNFEIDSLTKIKFYNGETATVEKKEVSMIGYSSYHDIAVLRVVKTSDAFKVSPLSFDIKETPVAGENLFSISNSYNYGLGLFEGKVSIPCQSIYVDVQNPAKTVPVTQITLPVNKGSSGSPIINYAGKVVGIGTYQVPVDEAMRPIENMSFCVPALIADKVINQIINDNPVGILEAKDYTTLGVKFVKSPAEKFEIDFAGYGFKGILRSGYIEVTETYDDLGDLITLRDRAFKKGDSITKFGSLELKPANDIFDIFALSESYRYLSTISQESKRFSLVYKPAASSEKKEVFYSNIYEKNF